MSRLNNPLAPNTRLQRTRSAPLRSPLSRSAALAAEPQAVRRQPKMISAVHRSAFLKELVAQFPQVRPRLEGYRTGVHLEVAVFRDLTQEAIDRGDMEAAAAQFNFATWALLNGNREVQGALRVSYLEDLELRGKSGRKAFELMPPELRTVWRETHEYLGQLLGRHDPMGQLAILPDRLPRKKAQR